MNVLPLERTLLPLKSVPAQPKLKPMARSGLTYQAVRIFTPVVLSTLTLLPPLKSMSFYWMNTGPMPNSQSPAAAPVLP